jgi:hypothetical protein
MASEKVILETGHTQLPSAKRSKGEQYRVTQVRNRITPTPGDWLTQDQVTELLNEPKLEVVIQAATPKTKWNW